ncbi:MAG: alpha/beta hydrolase [Desulfuromonadales bacterium]|nr:MAG: alpha/beta hydrolase [Desulfuromonadales bacterium]
MKQSDKSPLNHPLLSQRYFYPWPSRFNDPFFIDGDGFRLGCRYRRISVDAPTIIHFHGNGETVADYVGDFEQRIAALGANLLLADYRGYGMSSGVPALAAMLADVELIVRSSGVDPARIIFFGRSLGSLYAVHGAGLFPHAAGLILESGIADPLERILLRVEPWQIGTDHAGLREAVDRELNQGSKLASFRGRTLVMHTRNDDLVPVPHAERLFGWANEPKELIIFERGDHNTILPANEEAYFTAVEHCIRQL